MHINWLGPTVRDWLTARLLPSVPFCITEHNELAKRPRPKLRNPFHVCSVVVRVGYSIHPLLSWATKHLLRDQRYDQISTATYIYLSSCNRGQSELQKKVTWFKDLWIPVTTSLKVATPFPWLLITLSSSLLFYMSQMVEWHFYIRSWEPPSSFVFQKSTLLRPTFFNEDEVGRRHESYWLQKPLMCAVPFELSECAVSQSHHYSYVKAG